jgi:hypothetical protein
MAAPLCDANERAGPQAVFPRPRANAATKWFTSCTGSPPGRLAAGRRVQKNRQAKLPHIVPIRAGGSSSRQGPRRQLPCRVPVRRKETLHQ